MLRTAAVSINTVAGYKICNEEISTADELGAAVLLAFTVGYVFWERMQANQGPRRRSDKELERLQALREARKEARKRVDDLQNEPTRMSERAKQGRPPPLPMEEILAFPKEEENAFSRVVVERQKVIEEHENSGVRGWYLRLKRCMEY